MSQEGPSNKVLEGKLFTAKEKVSEKKLLKSVSKTNNVFAFLKSYWIDILVYGLIYKAGVKRARLIWLIPSIAFLYMKDNWTARRDNNRFQEVIKTLRDDEKPLVLADTTQLPPWVHYPDVERCSWLNKLITHFWPYISNIVTEKVQALASDKKTKGLKLCELSLGTVPPTLSGMKVYDKKVSMSHLMMDVNLCYSGDSKISISYLGVPVGIENFQLRGPARLDFLIINELPFFGGVEFSFLGLPDIDFTLTGIGSIGFTEEALRSVINSRISSLVVFPHKVGHMWATGSEPAIEDPKGVVRLNVIEAKQLESKDLIGLSDPYAEVTCGTKTVWSKVIDNTMTPYWDLWCEFAVRDEKSITIKVMDRDTNSSDDFIGSYTLDVSDVEKEEKKDSWCRLQQSKGSIRIRAFFLKLSPDVKHVNFPSDDLSFLSSYVLTVLVKSAHNIKIPRSEKLPSSSVLLTVGNDTRETKKIENHNHPVYGDFFTFMVNNPDFNTLRAQVVDGDSEIGSFSYSLRKLLDRKDLEIIDQHFPLLDSATDSTVVLSMRLRVIKNRVSQ